MGWREVSIVAQRREFVELASKEGCNRRELCRRFGISSRTAYKWLGRYEVEGDEGLADRSRQPQHSPRKTGDAIERQVLKIRDTQPAWGARTIQAQLGNGPKPAVSTVHAILKRHGRICDAASEKAGKWQRFEHEQPNQLWQMDYKGHFPLGNRQRCHPLTLLDDHSRYLLCLQGCLDERSDTVKQILTGVFRRYGLPDRMTMDNGPVWEKNTALTVWMMRLGIGVVHSRPHHPQTQGKLERLHRTLKAELLNQWAFEDLESAQQNFDHWRNSYNHQRPHQALGMQSPGSRYQVSWKRFPEALPAIEYGPDVEVRKVQQKGAFHFRGQTFGIGKAFIGYPIGLRPTLIDGRWDILFCTNPIGSVDLNA